MKNIVLDSSVFIKLFVKENDSAKAFNLVTKTISEERPILVPELFNYEIFSVYCANKELDLKEIYTWFKICKPYMIKSPLTQELIAEAINITKHGTTKSGYPSFYDCVYHAIAIQEKCTFITADEKHFDKTHKKFGHIKLLKHV